MSCNNDINPCGCLHEHSSKCIFYYGENLPCIDVVYGDDLETILTNINTAVCDLTPSGSTYSFSSCDSNIVVTSTTSGTNTDVEICLDSDLVTEITNNTSAISAINACLTNTIADILSDTITITEESSDSCGRTLRLEFTPSGSIVYDGIIYNDLNKNGTSGAVGDKVLKSFTTDYTDYNFTEGDEIRFKSNGQILGDTADVDSVKFEVFDVNSATLLYSSNFSGFDKVNKQSWKLEGDITYTDITSGEVAINIDFFANSLQNGSISNLTNNSQMVVNSIFNISDITNLRLRLVYDHQSTSGATNNFARQFLVEIRKKI
jgi:hypothetical protein